MAPLTASMAIRKRLDHLRLPADLPQPPRQSAPATRFYTGDTSDKSLEPHACPLEEDLTDLPALGILRSEVRFVDEVSCGHTH